MRWKNGGKMRKRKEREGDKKNGLMSVKKVNKVSKEWINIKVRIVHRE